MFSGSSAEIFALWLQLPVCPFLLPISSRESTNGRPRFRFYPRFSWSFARPRLPFRTDGDCSQFYKADDKFLFPWFNNSLKIEVAIMIINSPSRESSQGFGHQLPCCKYIRWRWLQPKNKWQEVTGGVYTYLSVTYILQWYQDCLKTGNLMFKTLGKVHLIWQGGRMKTLKF